MYKISISDEFFTYYVYLTFDKGITYEFFVYYDWFNIRYTKLFLI